MLANRITALSLLLFGLSGSVGAEEGQQMFRVGLIEFSPLVTAEAPKPDGPLFDYAQNILRKAGIKPHYQEVSINRSLEEIKNNHLDMVLTLFKTAERESIVRFSRDPLLLVEIGFCTGFDVKKHPLTNATRMAHVRGTLVSPLLQNMILTPVNGEKAQSRMLQMIMRKRVDAIYSPKPAVIMLAARAAGFTFPLHCYQLKQNPMPIYFGFSKTVPENLVQKIEESLHRELQDEDFDHFLQKRLKESGIPEPDVQLIDVDRLPAGR